MKPDARFYKALCGRLNLLPQEVLMIGDTWRCDYSGATGVGLRAIHLDRHGEAGEDERRVSTSDLRGVLSFIERR